MKSSPVARRIALIAGSAAIIGMGTLTAGCSSSTKEAPETTTPSATTSAPAISSTEKVIPQPVVPSIEDRSGMDAGPCGPGMSKINGVCQSG